MTKLSFRIYRVDNEHPELHSLSLEAMPGVIIDKYNESKQQIVFIPVHTASYIAAIGNNKTIYFYKKESARALPHLWRSFFENSGVNFGQIHTELHHMVGFIVDNSNHQLFAITTGQAYVTFEKYVDYDFPLTIARKIIHPEIKGGEIKELTGYLQASSLQFRRPRRISSVESIGTIWTQFSGRLRDDILHEEEFTNIFGNKNKSSIEIKGSVGVKQKIIDFGRLAYYIDWLWRIYEHDTFPVESQNDFAFLDAVKKISVRRFPIKVQKLWQKLKDEITGSQNFDFALCHRDYAHYLNADSFIVKYDGQEYSFEAPPELGEVLSEINSSSEDISQVLETAIVEAVYDTESYQNVEGSLHDLICGEVVLDGASTYFLLNNEWFELKNDFVRMVKEEFETIVTDQNNYINLALSQWTQATEGAYNSSFKGRQNFIVGDKILTENAELFDLLHWDENHVYIMHVKEGFGVKTRDVTSQIFHSAQIVENDILASRKSLLTQHYDRLESPQISKVEFLRLFDKRRVYTLAYGRASVLSSNSADVRSNIAKLELVQLKNDMRRFERHAELKLQWIYKV